MNGKLVLVMVSLMLLHNSLKADDNGDFYVIAGYGYYEALFAGVKYEGVNKSRCQLGAGYNFNINNIKYLFYIKVVWILMLLICLNLKGA